MSLTPQQKADAERKMREIDFEKIVKQTIKTNTNKMKSLIQSLKDDPKAQRELILLANIKIGAQLVKLDKFQHKLKQARQEIKDQKQKLQKQKTSSNAFKQNTNQSIKEININLKKIQDTVSELIPEQQKKRQKIQQQLQKSLKLIQLKISQLEQQNLQIDSQNTKLIQQNKLIEDLIQKQEIEFKNRRQYQQEKAIHQKHLLIANLQALQGQLNEFDEINRQLFTEQKKFIDLQLALLYQRKKLSKSQQSIQIFIQSLIKCKEVLIKKANLIENAQNQSTNTSKQLSQQKDQHQTHKQYKEIICLQKEQNYIQKQHKQSI